MKPFYLLAIGFALGLPPVAADQLANGNFETRLHVPDGHGNTASVDQSPAAGNNLASRYALGSSGYLATNVTDPAVNLPADNYAISDVALIDTCHSSPPYPTGTYRSNYGSTTTLQGTNFIQRNMNALNIVVNMSQPYSYTFTSSDPNIPLSSTSNSTSFTIPATNNNGVKIYVTAINGSSSCKTTGDFIFAPTGYRSPSGTMSYVASPNPASSELTVSDGISDAAAPSAEPFTAELYDHHGRKMKLKKSAQGKAVLDTRDLPDGLYNLRMGTGKNVHSEQIQIKH